jgi:phosphoribosylanthranilate isomerase
VKICGVRDPEAVEYVCEAGADAIGLVFYERSPRAVSIEAAASLMQHVAPLVTTVGLFVDPDAAAVWRVLERCELDCLQFHGQEDASFCEQFQRPYLRAVSMRPGVDAPALVAAHPRARAVLFDAWSEDTPGGTGHTFAWERIPRLRRPWILAGGLTPENVAAALRQTGAPAVDVSGGVEVTRGVKDKTKVQQFMAAVRDQDRRRDEAGPDDQ